jgi:ribosomal protein L37AE/L43A
MEDQSVHVTICKPCLSNIPKDELSAGNWPCNKCKELLAPAVAAMARDDAKNRLKHKISELRLRSGRAKWVRP